MAATPMPGDDGDARSLLLGLDRQERYLAKRAHKTLRLGSRRVPAERVLKTIRELRLLTLRAHGTPAFARELAERFEVVIVSDNALVTAYHSPLIKISAHKTAEYNVPILGRPPDLVEKRGKVYRRIGGQLMTPPTRAQIMDGALNASALAVAWTDDPVTYYYTQIQGGAVAVYPDGRRKTLLYAGNNGHGYVSIEPEILRRVPVEQRPGGYLGLRDYLRRHPPEAEQYFRLNPRYIFFKLSNKPPMGMAGLPLTVKRSIATDKRHYSAGLIGLLTYGEPVKLTDGSIKLKQVQRLICDCDTGAAIKGPDRVDIYFGEGSVRDLFAAGVKNHGTLSYLLIKN